MKLPVHLLALVPLSTGLATNDNTRCRCRPHQTCWPSVADWNSLNNTIQGNLVAVKPVASVCHDPGFNQAQCEAATNASSDSVWRSAQPGAVQWTNWEAWPERNEICAFDLPRSSVCGQGRISLYSALVDDASHIQAAVRFAARHDIRLVIKNSGHCFLGRSTAPESLQISTYKMKAMGFHKHFVPAGAPTSKAGGGESAVTIGAGVQLKDLYEAAKANSLTVVAGSSHTVGAAGGYILGGGHSILGNWKGMASDNALEFKVIDARGDIVIANDYQNQDLFWALRGGGGGTFGVVVSVTIRTFPNAPAAFAGFEFNVPHSDKATYWAMVRDFHKHLLAISRAGGCGYYSVLDTVPANGSIVSQVSGGFAFMEKSTAEAHEAMDPLYDAMKRYAVSPWTAGVSGMPHISDFFDLALPGKADTTGGTIISASRLVSADFLAREDGPSRLADALRQISESSPGAGFTGHFIAGGAVASNNISTALNPAWRRTISHIAFGADWNSTTTPAEQKAIQDRLTNVELEKLRVLEPHMGAYLNEADPNERGFQRSFWGGNYQRLYRLKQEFDPEGLFISRKGVGSEDWDDAGLCRRGSTGKGLWEQGGQYIRAQAQEII